MIQRPLTQADTIHPAVQTHYLSARRGTVKVHTHRHSAFHGIGGGDMVLGKGVDQR